MYVTFTLVSVTVPQGHLQIYTASKMYWQHQGPQSHSARLHLHPHIMCSVVLLSHIHSSPTESPSHCHVSRSRQALVLTNFPPDEHLSIFVSRHYARQSPATVRSLHSRLRYRQEWPCASAGSRGAKPLRGLQEQLAPVAGVICRHKKDAHKTSILLSET